MHMLAELVEVVIGVDTHTAAVVTAATGAVVAQATVPSPRPAPSSCWIWPSSTRVSGDGRSRAPVATAPA